MRKIEIVMLLAVFAFAIYTIVIIYNKKQECDKVDGLLVRGLWSIECVVTK